MEQGKRVLCKMEQSISYTQPENWAGQKIGLLGGSFNPAHSGHVYISTIAKEALGLDAIWWMVSPQNPLKSVDGMGDYQQRLSAAQKVAQLPYIHVTDIEAQIGTNLTYQTLENLTKTFAKTNFVWLMGADNLLNFHKWNEWERIINRVPLAVFARTAYSEKARTSKAACLYHDYQLQEDKFTDLPNLTAPAWAFIACDPYDASATELREQAGSAQAALERVLEAK